MVTGSIPREMAKEGTLCRPGTFSTLAPLWGGSGKVWLLPRVTGERVGKYQSNAPSPVESREAPPTSSFPDFSEPP